MKMIERRFRAQLANDTEKREFDDARAYLNYDMEHFDDFTEYQFAARLDWLERQGWIERRPSESVGGDIRRLAGPRFRDSTGHRIAGY